MNRITLLFTFILFISYLACSNPSTDPKQDAGPLPDITIWDLNETKESTPEPETLEKTERSKEKTTKPDATPEKKTQPKPDKRSPEKTSEASPDKKATPKPKWLSIKAPTLGKRQGHAVVALYGEMYIMGGFGSNRQLLRTMEAYNPQTQKWRRAANLPIQQPYPHHINAAVVNGKIYLLGFLRGFKFQADGNSYAYSPKLNQWTSIKDMPILRARAASGVGVINGKIYVAGGLRGSVATRLMSSYNPKTNQWKRLADMPTPLDHVAAGVIDGKLYIAGGRRTSINAHQSKLYVYDPIRNSWSQKRSMPTSRGGAAAAVYKGRLYVFGGEGNKKVRSGVFKESEAYDPKTNQWKSLPSMKTPRHGTAAVTIGDRIYIPAGAATQSFGATATSEVFIPGF